MNSNRFLAAPRTPQPHRWLRQLSRPLRVVLAGWCCMLVLAATILVDAHEVRSAIFFSSIAIGMAAWVWLRGSKPALVISLVLGVLQTLEQVAYTVADVTDVLHNPTLIVGTLFGLAAGACLIVGSTLALAGRRTPHPTTNRVQ